ncbi:hypothetical protein HALO156_180258 [Halomonas sp. 156]|nr:hypothetical protein HALO156_180258 [Halomonas sp. 156]
MRHDLMAHLFIALPVGAFGDQYLWVLIDDLGGKAFLRDKTASHQDSAFNGRAFSSDRASRHPG